MFYDDAQYVILAKSLATGEGYRYLNLPSATPGAHFPPGYPLVLAALWRVMPAFPENVALFKGVNALLLGPVALCVFLFGRRRLEMSPRVAALCAAAATLSIPMLVLSSHVLSEMLFLALLLPLLLVAERVIARDDWRSAALLGLAVGVLCLVRSHALVLIPTLAISYAMRRRYRAAAIAALAGIAVLVPWQLWALGRDGALPVALRGSYGTYAAWWLAGVRDGNAAFLPAVLWQNVVTSTVIIMRSFSLAQNPVADTIALVGVFGLLLAGAVRFAVRARVTLIFVLLYLCLVFIWPFSPLRFVWGIWPLLVLMMCAGAQFIARFPRDSQEARGIRTAGLACGGIVLAGLLLFNVRGYVNAWWGTVGRSYMPRIRPQLEWVARHTQPQDVIVAEDEGAVYLYTGRRAVPATSFTATQYLTARDAAANAAVMTDVLRTYRPAYVIAWAIPTQQVTQLLSRPPAPYLVPIDTLGGATVYRRVRDR